MNRKRHTSSKPTLVRAACLIAGALGACAASADDSREFALTSASPFMQRLTALNATAGFCNGIAGLSTLNPVPYAQIKVRFLGGLVSILVEPIAPTPTFDPFVAIHCSPAGVNTADPDFGLLGLDDDRGGYPKARLDPNINYAGVSIGDYYLFVTSYSSRPDRRLGRFRVTLFGNATFVNCPGDLTLDGAVDDLDFTPFANAYDILDCAAPSMPVGCPSDLNADGIVDDADFLIFVQGYNALLCP